MGLLLGLMGGAMGVWLFHTDEGEETLRNLKAAWKQWSEEHDVPATTQELTEHLEQATTMISDTRDKFPKFRRKTPDAS